MRCAQCCDPGTPENKPFWSDERLKKFLTDHDMQKFADCAACAIGLVTSQTQPIGKVFCIACTDQVLATGLERRFQCKCTQDHAPLNQVNYPMMERYSYKSTSLLDSIVVQLHFVGLINRKKHRDFVCH